MTYIVCRRSLWHRFILWISPRRRRAHEADQRALMREACRHADEPITWPN
ncbi:MAG: hypothetical protein M1541_04850 [Acidobacteria bacterium]|nr:hypothetical protein [Acidobacteriota bacterium]